MRERVVEIMSLWGKGFQYPNQEMIDRADAVSRSALGPGVDNSHITGNMIITVWLAMTLNRDFIMQGGE